MLTLRPPTDDDAAPLAAILDEPEVARWWGTFDLERVRRELMAEGDGLVVVVDDAVAGWISIEEEDDPDYRHVAFDLFLATALHGRGHGRDVLRRVIRQAIARGHHRFTIDPAVANERAIRAYAAVGFRRVGVLRSYGRNPDGTWHDGVLMELLAEDLVG